MLPTRCTNRNVCATKHAEFAVNGRPAALSGPKQVRQSRAVPSTESKLYTVIEDDRPLAGCMRSELHDL